MKTFITFISGIVESLIEERLFAWIANILFTFFKLEKKTSKKVAFEARSKHFHSEISPYLLKEVIPKLDREIGKKLCRYTCNGEEIIFPYIDLKLGKEITILQSLQIAKREFPLNYELIEWLKRELNKTVTNNPTFIISGISSNFELSIGIGDYYSTISTADMHYFNLIRYFPIKNKLVYYFIYRHFKYMSKWLSALRMIVLNKDYSHYCASIACSVLTVLKSSDGKYKYLIMKDSVTKASAAFEHHVIPSFMFQPIASRESEQERELDLELSVIREYGEELLGLKKLESAETVDILLGYIKENNLLDSLHKKIKTKEFFLEKTGFILDIYRLRPEITFLLVIPEKEYSESIKLSWETEESSLELIDLYDDSAYFDLLSTKENPICAPGAAALINGRNRAIEVLAKKFNLNP